MRFTSTLSSVRPPRAARGRGDGWLAGRFPRRVAAFSLVELMVVIGIIGILAAIGIPALRGLGESNAIDAASRQVLDDLAYARQRALNDRTTVYLLLVPPNVELQSSNLAPFRYTGYTLFSRRSIGEQPGRQNPRQLIPWRTLPDKTFFAVSKYVSTGTTNVFERSLAWTNNFPLVITNRLHPSMSMYYLAFNPQGQVVRFDGFGRPLTGQDEYLALVKGSVFHPQNADGTFVGPPDLVDVPRGNRRYIRVNWLTGRAQTVGDLLGTATDGSTTIAGQPE